MVRNILYAFAGVIVGYLVGILINQAYPLFPNVLLLFVPAFLGGVWAVVISERVNYHQASQVSQAPQAPQVPQEAPIEGSIVPKKPRIIIPIIITILVVVLYGFYWQFTLRPIEEEYQRRIDELLFGSPSVTESDLSLIGFDFGHDSYETEISFLDFTGDGADDAIVQVFELSGSDASSFFNAFTKDENVRDLGCENTRFLWGRVSDEQRDIVLEYAGQTCSYLGVKLVDFGNQLPSSIDKLQWSNEEARFVEVFAGQADSSVRTSVDWDGTQKLLVRVFDDSNTSQNESGIYLIDAFAKTSEKLIFPSYEFVALSGNNLVLSDKEKKRYYRYDFAENDFVLLNFPTLVASGSLYEELYLGSEPVGEDRALLRVATYDSTDSEYDYGGRAPRSIREYIYSFSQDVLEPSSRLERAGEMVSSALNSQDYNLRGFNEERGLAFYQRYRMGDGPSDIAVLDVGQESIEKQQKLRERLYINPSLDFGFYVLSGSDSRSGNLVLLDEDLSLLYSFDLNRTVGLDLSEKIYSVEWLDDSNVLVSFGDGIAMLDFKRNVAEIIYSDSTLGQSYLSWDRSVFGSDGRAFVALVDYYSVAYKECAPWDDVIDVTCPSSDANDNRYRVIVKGLFDKSEIIFLDDGSRKSILGWVDL